MSRTPPTIIESCIDPTTYTDCNLLNVEFFYAVAYDGKLFQLRKTRINDHKYIKPIIVNFAMAEHMRDRFNKLFHTNRFSIVKLYAIPLVAPPIKRDADDDYGDDYDYRRLG